MGDEVGAAAACTCLLHETSRVGVVVVQVVLAAGDTFRAAAAEQLEEWVRRSDADIVRAENDKTRPGTVLYNVSCSDALGAQRGPGGGRGASHAYAACQGSHSP